MSGDPVAVKAVRVRIEGRVQGVWFRGWTVKEATARGLSGWVCNRSDGTVEAVFAGDPRVVDEMTDACWQGPPSARVTAVHAKPADMPAGPGFRWTHGD